VKFLMHKISGKVLGNTCSIQLSYVVFSNLVILELTSLSSIIFTNFKHLSSNLIEFHKTTRGKHGEQFQFPDRQSSMLGISRGGGLLGDYCGEAFY